MAKRAVRYTLADAANNVGIALLLFFSLTQIARLGGGALLRYLYPAWSRPAPEWANQLYVLCVTVISFGGACLFLWRRGQKQGLRLSFRLGPLPLWILLALFLGCMVAANSVSTLIETIVRGILQLPAPSTAQLPETTSGRWMYFAGVCLVSPVLEELMFRGAAQGLLRPWGRRLAIGFTSVVFTLLHSSVWDLPAVFLLSLLLGYVAEVSGSLLPCMLLHFANNLYVFLTLLLREMVGDVSSLALMLWLVLLLVAAFAAAVWTVRHKKLGARLFLPKDGREKPGRKPRWRRVLEAPAFLAGLAATLVSFVLRVALV